MRAAGNWEVLRCAGQNGLVSVLAALCFWGLAAFDDDARDAWTTALNNIFYAILQLA